MKILSFRHVLANISTRLRVSFAPTKRSYIYIIGVGLCLSANAQQKENHNAQVLRNLEIFNNIYRQLDLFYVDTLNADTVMQWGIHSMLAHVDPFTDYYPDDDEDLRQMATGKYAGIGSVIRFSKKQNRVVISQPYEGTPSQKAGVRAGDIILSIDGKDVEGMKNPEVSSMLRGEAGTTFELKVQRPGEDKPRVFPITRETIQLPQVPFSGMLTPEVGFISLTEFTDGAYREVRRSLHELMAQGCQRLVLDLRDNPGGAVNEAVDIVNLFLPKGEKVVFTKGKMSSADRTYYTANDPVAPDMPLVVLVNGGSASASEIVSGCLQDLDRAVLVGARTYGKGLVQAIRNVNNLGNLKVTTARYHIPSGRCIQAYDYRHRNADGSAGTVPDSLTNLFHTRGGRPVRDGGGIKPDVEVPYDSLPTLLYDLADSEELFDFATQYASQHPTIAPAREFHLTDDEYQQFIDFVAREGFTYNRRSEQILDLLREMAEREGYLERAKDEFEALKTKLNVDLRTDLEHFRPLIIRLVEDEIVQRYYHQRGAVQHALIEDSYASKALDLLNNLDNYHSLLAPHPASPLKGEEK